VSLSRLTGFVLAAAISWVPVAPPEHVHESRVAGRHRLVVHRHAERHGSVYHAAGQVRAVQDDHAPILTLSVIFTIPAEKVLPTVPVADAVVTLELPVVPVFHCSPQYIESLIHGPPRAPSGLRAPPTSFLV